MDSLKLNILHDHYKETFSHIRERERQRNRLFVLIVALIGILFIEISYSDIFPKIFENINLGSFNLDLSKLPIFVFISITWTYLFILVLNYCQAIIIIEKHYEYLHTLEKKLSDIFNDKEIYSREGRVYLKNYSAFSNFVWIIYVHIFPVIFIISIAFLIIFEWGMKNSLYPYLIYDSIIAITIAFCFFLHRIWPLYRY